MCNFQLRKTATNSDSAIGLPGSSNDRFSWEQSIAVNPYFRQTSQVPRKRKYVNINVPQTSTSDEKHFPTRTARQILTQSASILDDYSSSLFAGISREELNLAMELEKQYLSRNNSNAIRVSSTSEIGVSDLTNNNSKTGTNKNGESSKDYKEQTAETDEQKANLKYSEIEGTKNMRFLIKNIVTEACENEYFDKPKKDKKNMFGVKNARGKTVTCPLLKRGNRGIEDVSPPGEENIEPVPIPSENLKTVDTEQTQAIPEENAEHLEDTPSVFANAPHPLSYHEQYFSSDYEQPTPRDDVEPVLGLRIGNLEPISFQGHDLFPTIRRTGENIDISERALDMGPEFNQRFLQTRATISREDLEQAGPSSRSSCVVSRQMMYNRIWNVRIDIPPDLIESDD